MQTQIAPKVFHMPERFLKILKEPGEALTAGFALLTALISGGTLRAIFTEQQPIVNAGISAVAAIISVYIIYSFRLRMLDRRADSDDHTTDTQANIDLVARQNRTIEVLTATDLARQTWYEKQIHGEREVKHALDGALTAALLSAFMVRERINTLIDIADRLETIKDPDEFRAVVVVIRQRVRDIYTNHALTPEALEERINTLPRVPDVQPFNPRTSLDPKG